jgi:hypothetical protein
VDGQPPREAATVDSIYPLISLLIVVCISEDASPGHAVWPGESYGLIGKKGTFGGKVAPYKTFPDEPVGSWK